MHRKHGSYFLSNTIFSVLDIFADSCKLLFYIYGTEKQTESKLYISSLFISFACLFVHYNNSSLLQMVSGVGTLNSTSKVSSEGDGETGSVILGLSEQLVVAMTPSTETKIKKEVHTSTVGKTKLNFTLTGQI